MRWTRCRALLDRALLKGEELGGRSLGACSPAGDGSWARPWLPEAADFKSWGGVGAYPANCLRSGQERETCPKESD